MADDSPFELVKRDVVYDTDFLKVYRDQITGLDGSEHIYSWATPSDGVAIVALNADDEVYLLREFKYATDEFVWSLPAGGVEKDEEPLISAKRELLEEVGLESDNWTTMGYFYPSPGTYKQTAFLFIAQEVKEVSRPDHEATTKIEIKRVKFNTALKMIYQSEILDSFGIVALLKAKQVLKSTR